MTPAQLKARRLALGLTQAELAHELGIQAGSVSRYERGDPEHPIPKWLLLALKGLATRKKPKA